MSESHYDIWFVVIFIIIYFVNGIGVVAEAVLELHHGGVVVQDGVIDYGGGIEAFEVCGSEEAVVP